MYLKEDPKNTGRGNSLKFTKHIGIMISLVSELKVAESIKGKYYVCLLWFNSFFHTCYGSL